MQVVYEKEAVKGLRKMPKADAQAIMRKLGVYAETGRGDVKKLQGREAYRLRHGQWRALFRIEGDLIVVVVGPRRSVCR